jgi:hypothetical protein
MKRGLFVASVLLVAMVGPGCRCVPRMRANRGHAAPKSPAVGGAGDWPERSARWPSRCLLSNIGMHPTKPWLTATCDSSVLLFDVPSGTMRSASVLRGEGGRSRLGGRPARPPMASGRGEPRRERRLERHWGAPRRPVRRHRLPGRNPRRACEFRLGGRQALRRHRGILRNPEGGPARSGGTFAGGPSVRDPQRNCWQRRRERRRAPFNTGPSVRDRQRIRGGRRRERRRAPFNRGPGVRGTSLQRPSWRRRRARR